MNIRRETMWLDGDNLLEVVEVVDEGDVKHYGYTYSTRDGDSFNPVARWDNINFQPHVDQYDDAGILLKRQKDRGKSQRQVINLIKIFGRSLRTVDLANIF